MDSENINKNNFDKGVEFPEQYSLKSKRNQKTCLVTSFLRFLASLEMTAITAVYREGKAAKPPSPPSNTDDSVSFRAKREISTIVSKPCFT
jgi:hypothetical protein